VPVDNVVMYQLHESEAERHRLEDANVQLVLRLENMTVSMTESRHADNEMSLFAELDMLSHSLSVDSFSNQPTTNTTTVATQVHTAQT